MHEDQFACRVGRLEAAVRVVELFDLVVAKPVAETVVEQGFRLRVERLVWDPDIPGVVDRRDFERQPAPVAGVVGEELEVVARSRRTRLRGAGVPCCARRRGAR